MRHLTGIIPNFWNIKIIHVIVFIFLSLHNVVSYGQDNEVISFKTIATVENGKLVITRSYIIQINNRRGEDLTKISIPFSKRAKIQSLDGWIEDNRGNIVRKLKKQNITDISAVSSFSLYEDDFVRQFELRHNEYPYRVCYNYEIRFDEFLTIIDWEPLVDIHTPTRNAELTIETPLNYPVNIYQRGVSKFTVDTVEQKIIRRWKTECKETLKYQNYAPSLDDLTPLVMVVPLNFKYGIAGDAKSWASYGNWQYRLNEGLDLLSDEEKSNLDRLLKGITNKKEIIKKVYHYVQDRTHYVNVSIDIGGFKTYPADYVAKNKYGDCKALSNYMQSLLKHVNIPSFYTKVMAGENESEIIKQLPGPQFNHIILTVPLEKDTVWLDCTNNTAPFGYLGTFTQGRWALMVDKQDSKLIRTPSLKKQEVLELSSSNIKIDPEGNAVLDYSLKSGGYTFELLKQIKNEFNNNQQDRILREIISIDNATVNHWEINTPDRDTASTSLLMNLTIHNFSRKLSDNIIFNLIPLNIPTLEQPADRKLPLQFSYPVFMIDSTMVTEPAGYHFTTIPKPISITSIFGNYNQQYFLNNHKLISVRRFELHSGEYPLVQYREFYQFYKSLKDSENNKLILARL